jgi:4-hydroxybenzoyl-CoA thioesterase/acyl-CoA thioester hydrolase
MTPGFAHQVRVEFRDTDAAGIAHFSVFLVWMEQAEHAALRSLGLSVMPRSAAAGAPDPLITWPRVSAHCDYLHPVFFEDVVQIEVTISKLGEKSVTYQFDFRAHDRVVARGQIVTVCCEVTAPGTIRSIPIPAPIASVLQRLVR